MRATLNFSDLWRWSGTLGRGPYLFWAVALFAVKFVLDWAVSEAIFGRSWNVFDYFRTQGSIGNAFRDNHDRVHYASLLLLSLPFLWAGVVLTLRRLRSARLPEYLVLLFFIPIIKLFLFGLLGVLPEAKADVEPTDEVDGIKTFLGRLIPRHPAGSAAAGIFASLAYTALAVWLGTKVLRNYGWTLFVGLPFWLGFSSVFVFGYHRPQSLRACLQVAALAMVLAGAAMLLTAFEGLICLIMAAPIAILMSLAGGAVAYRLQASGLWRYQTGGLLGVLILAIPSVMQFEHFAQGTAPTLQVRSAVVVNAPPEQVWRHVVSFADLPPPNEWLFRAGIAYPIRAEIRGRGVGAVRHCTFSTGSFVEPIEYWDEPRRLSFAVTANPEPMQEWTPYRHVHPPHLDGFLISKQGEFRLIRLPNGNTQLEGTTWYQHHLWPVWYWQAWSDYIIHKIHLRVLRHVKALAEQPSMRDSIK